MQNIKNRQNILFVTHPHHRYTQSFDWLYKAIEEVPDILYGDHPTLSQWLPLLEKDPYKLVIVFQLDHLALYCSYFSPVLVFPMFDHSRLTPDSYLRRLKSVEWVSFSRGLHHRLSGLGLSSRYIQYACDPKPYPQVGWNSGPRAYFWERVPDEFDRNAASKILASLGIDSLIVRELGDKGFSRTPQSHAGKKPEIWTDRSQYLQTIAKENIFVAPRRFEGLGMTMIEAMAMGMCVIAEDAPTANEYILSGHNGILYRGGQEMVYPLRATTGKQLAEMGDNARKSIAEIHQRWSRDSENIGSLVRKLLSTPWQRQKPPYGLLEATVRFEENRGAFWKACEALPAEGMIWRSQTIQTRFHSRHSLTGRVKWFFRSPRACLLDWLGKG